MHQTKLKYAYFLNSVYNSKSVLRLIIIFLSLTGCSPKLISPIPTSDDASRGKAIWTDCTIEKLKETHTLYINKCGSCHGLKDPKSESEEAWRKIVPPMAKKAKISSAEQDLILNYLLVMRGRK